MKPSNLLKKIAETEMHQDGLSKESLLSEFEPQVMPDNIPRKRGPKITVKDGWAGSLLVTWIICAHRPESSTVVSPWG